MLTNSFIHMIISHFQRIRLANDDCPATKAKNYCLTQRKSLIALQARPMQEMIIRNPMFIEVLLHLMGGRIVSIRQDRDTSLAHLAGQTGKLKSYPSAP